MTDNSFWGDAICKRISDKNVRIENYSLDQIAMIVPSERLLIKTGWAFSTGDIIVTKDIEIFIKTVYHIFWPLEDLENGYNVVAEVECSKMAELKELLNG